MLKPKTPSMTMSARLQMSDTSETWLGEVESVIDTPAATAARSNESSRSRSKQMMIVVLTPARARYVAATMASPPLFPLPASTATLASLKRGPKSDNVQSAIARPTSSINFGNVVAPELNHCDSMSCICCAVTAFIAAIDMFHGLQASSAASMTTDAAANCFE